MKFILNENLNILNETKVHVHKGTYIDPTTVLNLDGEPYTLIKSDMSKFKPKSGTTGGKNSHEKNPEDLPDEFEADTTDTDDDEIIDIDTYSDESDNDYDYDEDDYDDFDDDSEDISDDTTDAEDDIPDSKSDENKDSKSSGKSVSDSAQDNSSADDASMPMPSGDSSDFDDDSSEQKDDSKKDLHPEWAGKLLHDKKTGKDYIWDKEAQKIREFK